ncbi:MAG: hypothetical protein AAF436_18825 [Myxococcota bacterium]
MPSWSYRSATFVWVLSTFGVVASGCFGSSEATCGPTASSVAMSLEDRYALGSGTTVRLGELEEPSLTSSDPSVVRVAPMDEEGDVRLDFVGLGAATITVSDAYDSASAKVAVSAIDRFELVLNDFDTEIPPIPFEKKIMVNPQFVVRYFDEEGRLYGNGLAETSWEAVGRLRDRFSNRSLEPGAHEVTVRAGGLSTVATFIVVDPGAVVRLGIFETELGDDRVRVDGVGFTEIDAPVWNVPTYMEVDREGYLEAFEYVRDPEEDPAIVVTTEPFGFFSDPVEPGRDEIRRERPVPEYASAIGSAEPRGVGAPTAALLSLLAVMFVVRRLTQRRAP